jgi:hypothetical protein
MELPEKSEASVDAEKRKHPRFNVDLPIKYGRTQLFLKYARAVNASQGGLLLRLPEEVEIGQHLALKLFFPSHASMLKSKSLSHGRKNSLFYVYRV